MKRKYFFLAAPSPVGSGVRVMSSSASAAAAPESRFPHSLGIGGGGEPGRLRLRDQVKTLYFTTYSAKQWLPKVLQVAIRCVMPRTSESQVKQGVRRYTNSEQCICILAIYVKVVTLGLSLSMQTKKNRLPKTFGPERGPVKTWHLGL